MCQGGSRYVKGDPVLVPDPDAPKRPRLGIFEHYISLSGNDRKCIVVFDGSPRPCWESYVVPDMELWFRGL